MTEVKIKLLPLAFEPTKGSEQASGWDLYASIPEQMDGNKMATIRAGDNMLIPTGVCMELPSGYEAQVRPRSGLAKEGIVGAFGTVDSDYRGEVKVNLFNHSWKPYTVKNGDRIGQLVIQKVESVEMIRVTELSETKRGEGGFGSSGR